MQVISAGFVQSSAAWLLGVLILGTVGNIECGFMGVRAGAVTLAALAAGLAVALAWPERRG